MFVVFRLCPQCVESYCRWFQFDIQLWELPRAVPQSDLIRCNANEPRKGTGTMWKPKACLLQSSKIPACGTDKAVFCTFAISWVSLLGCLAVSHAPKEFPDSQGIHARNLGSLIDPNYLPISYEACRGTDETGVASNLVHRIMCSNSSFLIFSPPNHLVIQHYLSECRLP